MTRKELVAAAGAAGIKKASTIKSAKLEKMLEKIANGVRRGRPVVAGSKRQAVLAMREQKRAAGIEVKRGRPKGSGVKTEQVEVELDANVEVEVNEIKDEMVEVTMTDIKA